MSERLVVIEPLQEEQVGDLLDDFDGVREPPLQKAFQRASTLLRISPASIGYGGWW